MPLQSVDKHLVVNATQENRHLELSDRARLLRTLGLRQRIAIGLGDLLEP